MVHKMQSMTLSSHQLLPAKCAPIEEANETENTRNSDSENSEKSTTKRTDTGETKPASSYDRLSQKCSMVATPLTVLVLISWAYTFIDSKLNF